MKQVLIICFLSIATLKVTGQEALAKMRMDYVSKEGKNEIYFHKGESVVVFKPLKEKRTWAVWNENGNCTNLDTTTFQIIQGKPIFKIKTDPRLLRNSACTHHTRVLSRQIKVNYCRVIRRVSKKKSNALSKFFNLIPQVDAALAEIHASDTWSVINLYTDDELYTWLKTLNSNRLKQIVAYLKEDIVAYPISRYREYLSLYYPKSWAILRNYE